MIVNYQEKGWQIISQRAHGLLAGQFCFYWKNDMRPERWLETIIATTEHDDAFNEFVNDDNLINENGGPINFKMRVFEEAKCDELLQLALSKSRYIALLTSRHIQFLYQHSDQKDAREFCKMLEKWDRKWLKETGLKKEEITWAYAVLEWCDALSLLICQQLIQPENRKIEISGGPDNLQYQLWSKNESELTIEPWPFIKDSFTITYESKLVSKLTFKDVKEFREDLKDAPLTIHTFQISRR
ncbi:DUF3891 family protein [Dyadobacter sediminis]|uniref:DUF3891 family protein n=1 Tax=Dyadobacter sediminis TaxID=1493691 RepID=A0A5R9KKJ4_9BACT|nr:DUF3891 family protein [Dyadobacter sediminis]TLU96737.1 DUF3891 family protein [Dyadobacter sediminis]GGB84751.1 hypothetical protein GCM10011325_10420 [Dyadobacter sediminis]